MKRLLVLALVLPGCALFARPAPSSPTRPPTSAPSVSPAPSATETPAVTAPPSPSPSGSPSPTVACPAGWSAASGGCAETFEADLDGDGKRERLSLVVPYPFVMNAAPRPWRLTGTLTSGGAVDATIAPTDEFLPSIVTSVDMNGDGRDEIALEDHRGASTDFVGFYAYAGGQLVPIEINGAPLLIGVEGSVGSGDGAECVKASDGDHLVVRSIGMTGSTATVAQYHWTEATYRWDGIHPVFLSSRDGDAAITLSEWPGPYAPFWRFDCFGVRIGG